MRTILILMTALALSLAQTPRPRFQYRPDNSRYDNSGQYRPDSSRYYDNSGQYRPGNYDNSGQYRPDNSGAYRAEEGRYYPDNSGAYVPDDSGAYTGDYEKYKHQEGPFGGGGGGTGGSGGFGSGGSSFRPGFSAGGEGSQRRPSVNIVVQPSKPGAGKFSGVGSKRPSGVGSDVKIASAGGFGVPTILKQGSAAGLYDNRNYAIIRKEEKVFDDGYHYLYETENKIYGEEQGKLANKGFENEAMQARGYFEYTGPDNVVYRVDYTANENGFVPVAAHIPTPPPIPEAIFKSLAYQRSIGEL